jgi:hypothetical protein
MNEYLVELELSKITNPDIREESMIMYLQRW